jgi:hypothetical protein
LLFATIGAILTIVYCLYKGNLAFYRQKQQNKKLKQKTKTKKQILKNQKRKRKERKMKTTKRILLVLSILALLVGCFVVSVSAADTVITFNLGINGSATHSDGSEKASYTETVDGYTLNITSGTKMYTGARDAKGNSCIKFGTSSAVGSMQFTVPNDVTSVNIYVAKYKANTTKVSINQGAATTLTKASNNGEYDVITVDTSSNKTVKFATVSGGARAMINTIEFVIASSAQEELTAAQKVEKEISNLSVIDKVVQDETITLPTASVDGVSVEWALIDGAGVATLANGELTITLGDAATTVKLQATITCEDESDTKDFEIAVPKADPPADSTLTITEAIALGLSKEHNEYTVGKYYVTGVIKSVYNTEYGNMIITDENGTEFTVYGTYLNGTKYNELENKPDEDDTITVYGIIGQFNGTAQIKNADITNHIDFVPEVTYDAIFNVAVGEAVETINGYKIELPAAEDFGNYVFVGWSTEAVSSTKTKPELFKAGDSFTLEENTTFYAVYSYTYEYSTGENTVEAWTLVNDASTLKAGDKIVIVAQNADYALGTNQKTSNRGCGAVVKSGNTVSFGDDVQIITLEAVGNMFAFYVNTNVNTGYLYAASTEKNYLKTQDEITDNGSWTITIEDGVATIKANQEKRNWLRYNPNNNSDTGPLFSCYTSGQEDVSIYKLTGGNSTVSVTNYTSFAADFEGAQVNLGENLSVKYKAYSAYNLEDLIVKFTMGNRTLEVAAVDGIFAFTNISPEFINASIKAEILYNGNVIGSLDGYSIAQNLENLIANNGDDEKLVALCEAALAYGAAAEDFTNKNSEAEALNKFESNEGVIYNVTDGAYFADATVFFGNVNKIFVKFNVLDANAVYINGKLATAVSSEDAPNGEDGWYATAGISATRLGAKYTFEVRDADGNALQSLQINVYAYCAALESNSTVYAANLAIALRAYGLAAAAYAN